MLVPAAQLDRRWQDAGSPSSGGCLSAGPMGQADRAKAAAGVQAAMVPPDRAPHLRPAAAHRFHPRRHHGGPRRSVATSPRRLQGRRSSTATLSRRLKGFGTEIVPERSKNGAKPCIRRRNIALGDETLHSAAMPSAPHGPHPSRVGPIHPAAGAFHPAAGPSTPPGGHPPRSRAIHLLVPWRL